MFSKLLQNFENWIEPLRGRWEERRGVTSYRNTWYSSKLQILLLRSTRCLLQSSLLPVPFWVTLRQLNGSILLPKYLNNPQAHLPPFLGLKCVYNQYFYLVILKYYRDLFPSTGSTKVPKTVFFDLPTTLNFPPHPYLNPCRPYPDGPRLKFRTNTSRTYRTVIHSLWMEVEMTHFFFSKPHALYFGCPPCLKVGDHKL